MAINSELYRNQSDHIWARNQTNQAVLWACEMCLCEVEHPEDGFLKKKIKGICIYSFYAHLTPEYEEG